MVHQAHNYGCVVIISFMMMMVMMDEVQTKLQRLL